MVTDYNSLLFRIYQWSFQCLVSDVWREIFHWLSEMTFHEYWCKNGSRYCNQVLDNWKVQRGEVHIIKAWYDHSNWIVIHLSSVNVNQGERETFEIYYRKQRRKQARLALELSHGTRVMLTLTCVLLIGNENFNWRGVWNKALSDFWCNVKFSSSFATEYKEIWKENLVIYQKSLKAFLQAPLQL